MARSPELAGGLGSRELAGGLGSRELAGGQWVQGQTARFHQYRAIVSEASVVRCQAHFLGYTTRPKHCK